MSGACAAATIAGSSTAFSVAASPPVVSAYGSSGAAANLTTSSTTVTPTGGVAPYTYAWTQVGTPPYTWVIGSAAAATTNFTCNSLGVGNSTSEDFLCTVTDAVGAKSTVVVPAYANNGQPYDPSVGAGGLGGGEQGQLA